MNTLIAGSAQYNSLKEEALRLYGVTPCEQFDVKQSIRQRIDYLKNFLRSTGMKGFVLGISGGVDSSCAGKLAQLACSELKDENYEASFIAVRLPSGVQLDEADAQASLAFINPDKTITVNIEQASKNIANHCLEQYFNLEDKSVSPSKSDFILGNTKARVRMLTQYHIGGLYNALVIGTDHSTEGICGFWTKWGDGSCDLLVLDGLNKSQVRLLAKELGAPEKLYSKVATADLEELSPQKTDESALGIDYPVLDAFLEGKEIDPEIEYKIIRQFQITQHKRKQIPGFTS